MDDDLLVALRVLEQNQRRIEGKLDALIAALADEEGDPLVDMDGNICGGSRDDSEVL